MKQSTISAGSSKNLNVYQSSQRETEAKRNSALYLPTIADSSTFRSQMQDDDYKDMIVTYIETENGKPVRRRLNLNSPRTKEAAAHVGATFEDCLIR